MIYPKTKRTKAVGSLNGGMEALTFNHPCIYNNDFTLVKDKFPGTLFTALADMADDGLPWHDLVISERWVVDITVKKKGSLHRWLHTENRRIHPRITDSKYMLR